MRAPKRLQRLAGAWTGRSRLWLSPGDATRESASTALVALAAKGKFVTVAYTWAFDDEPQDGLLLFGCDEQHDAVRALWIDSWHMSDKFMICAGRLCLKIFLRESA